MRCVAGACAVLAVVLAAPPAAESQEEFRFAGTWVGEFEEETEPERDLATRGDRDRAIAASGEYECDGTWQIVLRGPNENLRGQGVVEQECRARRTGLVRVPPEPIIMSNFEFEDEGEGKEKKLRWEMDLVDVKTNDSATIRCNAKGEYKPDDDVFEGEYSCRHTIRLRASGQRTMAQRIRGEFELRRDGADTTGF